MRIRSTLGRGLAAIVALAAAGLGLTACAPDVSVPIDSPPQVQGELPEDTRAALEDAVAHAVAASGASGAIVGVWVPWSGTWVAGVGTQDFESGTPVTTDMHFRIADATRPMICDVLYGVAAKGIVSLDDPVTDYVSSVPDLDDVSLLELCNGTSGVGSYQKMVQRMWVSNPHRVWDPRELASFGLGQTRSAEPGQAYRDSDAGYLLLGLALERATSTGADDLLTEYVFDPLDLTGTTLPADQWADSGPALTGLMTPTKDGVRQCTAPRDVTDVSASTGYTSAGVVSTIDDLGRYMQALASGALSTEGVDRWSDPLPVSSRQPSWFTATGGAFQAGSLIGQAGDMPGYTTAAYSDPATGMTVAVVLNNSTAGTAIGNYLAWELAAIASKAPAAAGETAPEFGLPWTPEQYRDAVTSQAICPIP
jgi:D-alanyl-D-alanine carboxypeptidase